MSGLVEFFIGFEVGTLVGFFLAAAVAVAADDEEGEGVGDEWRN